MFKRIIVLLTITFLLTSTSMPVFAQKERTTKLYNAAVADYELGNYKQALKKMRMAMKTAEGHKFSNYEYASGTLLLAELLRALGNYKESEKTFLESLAYAQKSGFRKKAPLSRIYNNLGNLYLYTARYQEAEDCFKKSEKVSDKNFMYAPVNNLVLLNLAWGKFDKAEEYLKRAKKLTKRVTNSSKPFYLNNLAKYERLRGNYKNADSYYKEALAILKKSVGEKHVYYTYALNDQAELYREQSKFKEAETIARKVLKIRQATFGEGNPLVPASMDFLAKVLADQGKYSEARTFSDKAIEIFNELFDNQENYFTAQAKHTSGNILRQQGKYAEAENVIREALAIEKRILGQNHVEIAKLERDLAKVKADESDFAQAETLLKSSMTNIESNTGPDHPERIASVRALGYLYSRKGNLQEAANQYVKALQLSETVLGANSKSTADSARDLGELYLKQKQYEQAVKYLSKALETDTALYGKTSPQVAGDMISLAGAYDALGKSEQANPLIAEASKIKRTVTGGTSISTPTLKAPVAFNAKDNKPIKGKWALAIGISNFKDTSINLRFAAKDATDFSNFLVNKENFKKDHVKLLTDQNATRENILNAIGSGFLGKNAHKDDLVLIYVSSHGSKARKEAGGLNFLVTHDTDKFKLGDTGIPMQRLTDLIKSQIKSDRVVLILDVCHSGAAAGGKGLIRSGANMNLSDLHIGSGQMVLCSSMAEQISWESVKYENSVFTRRLMESLQVNDEKTTLLQAFKRLKVLVESEVLRDRANLQTPLLWNKNWVGRDPIIAAKVDATSVN